MIGLIAARWRMLPRQLYCFNYHRVGDPKLTDFNRNIFSCSAERFEEHVRCLRERFDLLTMDRLCHLLNTQHVGRRPPALITFDDGYVDNYTTAFPILRRYGAPATFFLPTAHIGSSEIPWWEEIHWQLRQAAGRQVWLAGAPGPFEIVPNDGERSIRRVANFVKSRPIPMSQQMEEVREACGGMRPRPDQGRLFMDWREVREMQSKGMDFGAHTHTHAVLGHLDVPSQRAELTRSKEILEGVLGRPVQSVAYPVGTRTAYTPDTCAVAAAAGYRIGFNFLRRPNPLPLSNPLDVCRLAVSENARPADLKSMACFPRIFAE